MSNENSVSGFKDVKVEYDKARNTIFITQTLMGERDVIVVDKDDILRLIRELTDVLLVVEGLVGVDTNGSTKK